MRPAALKKCAGALFHENGALLWPMEKFQETKNKVRLAAPEKCAGALFMDLGALLPLEMTFSSFDDSRSV